MRLIDADALMEASKYEFWQDGSAITPIGEYILGKFRQLIRNMPTIEPEYKEIDFVQQHKKLPVNLQLERKKGMWLLSDGYRCSCCNYKLKTTGIPQSCPNCDAEMQQGG